MAIKVAINGFGRIGRNILRAMIENDRRDLQLVAINDLGPVATNAHLFKYDSVHGRFNGDVKIDGDMMDVGHGPFKVLAERDPNKLPWRDMGVDVVMECTGIFTDKEKASVHLNAGAKKVLVSAPSKGADLTVVYGVNHDKLEPKHQVVSNASCTTNCLAPVAKVLNDLCGITSGYMTDHPLVHQRPAYSRRRAQGPAPRAAPPRLNIIPTTTGAAKAVGLVLPELAGKLDGTAIRVPTPNVSVIDLNFIPTAPDHGRRGQRCDGAARHEQELKGILAVTKEPLVSTDFNHDPHSATFDLNQTQIVDGRLVRVMAWYDNEWGFSSRMADTAATLGKLI